MSSAISSSNINTWNFISKNLPGIELFKKGRSVEIEYVGKRIFLPPYPEIDSVTLIRKDNLIIPENIPNDWVAQWKANGSNIRIFAIDDVLIAITRGGYLLDWRPYQSIMDSPLKENLIHATMNGRYILFGELVGPKSLVKLCMEAWREYLNGDIGYILFDVYDRIADIFIDLKNVKQLAESSNLLFPPTEWELDVDVLNKRLRDFLEICDGEMWEGFVFKNRERGNFLEIKEKTRKWRLDETREFALEIYKRRSKMPLSWKIFEALRKFIIEGYLDPPITIRESNPSILEIRNDILSILKESKERAMREKADKKIKEVLNVLVDAILSEEVRGSEGIKKAKNEAIKIFRKVYIWSQ